MSPELRAIVSTDGAGSRTLLQTMQSSKPTLAKRTEDWKPTPDMRLKGLRMLTCSKLLEYSDTFFGCIFWMDANTMRFEPVASRVWVDSKFSMKAKSGPRMPCGKRDCRILHQHSMTTWCRGPVAMLYVTGNSGLQHAQPFTVSWLAVKSR